MLPPGCLHGAKDGPHHGAADAHEGDHDDEPADADGLADHHAAARLGIAPGLVPGVSGKLTSSPGFCIRILGSEREKWLSELHEDRDG